MVFDRIKKALSSSGDSDGEEYIEIDIGKEKKEKKVVVSLFYLKNYDDVTPILNAIREGYTIAIIDFKILKQKDPIELKRAVSKIKKTTDALEGSIGGFGDNILIVTPSFARIHKEAEVPKEKSKFA
ncbi:MAG: cell division protein SepF [Nanoarchaeota archaeon]